MSGWIWVAYRPAVITIIDDSMKYVVCLVCFAAIALCCRAWQTLTLADGGDKAPVAGASVISSNGMIVGTTDKRGRIRVERKDLPLSVRSLGYESVTITSTDRDSVFMTPATYSLSEVVINSAERPITRVVTYAREYCTGATSTDSLQLYSEYILEYFVADGKVKGYRKSDRSARIKGVRRYGRVSNSQGLDSVMRPGERDELTVLSFIEDMASVPSEGLAETEAMRGGLAADTVQGKYYPKLIYRKNNGLFSIRRDGLADNKEHQWSPWYFRMIGLTLEMRRADTSMIFRQNSGGRYGLNDFIYSTCNLHFVGKGRLLKHVLEVKDAVDMYCYIEQYPVEIRRLTVDEYKGLRDGNDCDENFKMPVNVQPQAAAVKALVSRVNREIPLVK